MLMFYGNAYADISDGRTEMEKLGFPIPVLLSYWEKLDLEIKKSKDGKFVKSKYVSKLMLDSGAYSAVNSGAVLRIEDFIKKIKTLPNTFDIVVALDVIGNPKKSFENYMIMCDAGVKCMPTFHLGSDIKYLYKLVDKTNFIGLGGMARAKGKLKNKFLDQVFRAFPDSSKVGFHGFGVNDFSLLLKYPWKTCDSTTMHLWARSGMIATPYGTVNINPRQHSFWQSRERVEKVKKYITDSGLSFAKVISLIPSDLICMDLESNKVRKVKGSVGTSERLLVNIKYCEELIKKVPTKYKTSSTTDNILGGM